MSPMTLHITREGDEKSHKFFSFLVEDKSPAGSSYHEFYRAITGKVNSKAK